MNEPAHESAANAAWAGPHDRAADAPLRPGDAATQLGISNDTLIRWGDLGRITYTHPHAWSRERRYSPAEVARVKAAMATTQPTEQEPTP